MTDRKKSSEKNRPEATKPKGPKEGRSKSKRRHGGSVEAIISDATQEEDLAKKGERLSLKKRSIVKKSKAGKKRSKHKSEAKRSHSSTDRTSEDQPTTDNTEDDGHYRRRRPIGVKPSSKRIHQQNTDTKPLLHPKASSKEEIEPKSAGTSGVTQKPSSSIDHAVSSASQPEGFCRPVPNLYFAQDKYVCSLSNSESATRQLSTRRSMMFSPNEARPRSFYFTHPSPPMSTSARPTPTVCDKKQMSSPQPPPNQIPQQPPQYPPNQAPQDQNERHNQ